mmetsp:Transcript_81188/g.178438  ORF Transcript_81188/g.178438 Transcript_81188/m.178438 type:complete len:103 (-) Transcript_81188:534-842(-)
MSSPPSSEPTSKKNPHSSANAPQNASATLTLPLAAAAAATAAATEVRGWRSKCHPWLSMHPGRGEAGTAATIDPHDVARNSSPLGGCCSHCCLSLLFWGLQQ